METDNRSREELLAEIEALRFRLEEAEAVIQAIQGGEVDAIVVSMPEGEQVFTLKGADYPYRVLVETMNEGAAFLSPDGVIVYCNSQLANMLRTPIEKLSGSPLGAYVASEDQALVAKWVENPAQKGERIEITLKTATGNRLPVLFSCSTVEISGRPGIGVVVTDITERKRVEEALRESESRFRTMANAAPVLIWVAGTDQRRIWVNQVWLDFTGRTQEQELGIGWTKGVHPDDLNRCLATRASHFEWREAFRMEYRLRRHDGKYCWLADHGVPLVDEQGQFTGYIGSCFDVTQAKDLTINLHQTLKSLGDESSRLQTILAMASDGIHILDKNGNVVQFSDLFARMLGYTHAETARLNVVDWDTEIPETELLDALNRLIQHPGKFETRHRRKDGSVIDVEINARGVELEGEDYLYASARDITESKKAKDTLEQLTQEQQAMLDNELVGIMKLRNRRITWKNKAMERIFGYRSGELDGQLIRILFSDDASYQANSDSVYPILNARGTYRTQLEMIRKDGEILWMDVNVAKLSLVDDESLWVLADISLIKKSQNNIEQIAFHDNLTGLPNRLLIIDRLHQALALAERSNQMLAVCYLDLDGFKPVNDSYGHEAGDKLLIEIAHRLQTSIRANDTPGRLGGDEFVLLLTNMESPDELSGALQRIMEAINQPVAIDNVHAATVSASIGIALFPQDGTDPDTLLRHADQAMYVAKQSGKNRYSMFDVNQDAALKIEQENLADIRRALDQHEFVLLYQPKVNLKTRAVIGVEALLRWQRPHQGMLLPAEFLPTVENHAYGIELGEWVIDTAFSQMAEWHEQNFDMPVSVNIAAYHLQGEGFVTRLCERFAAHPSIQPDHLELEVLESSALEDLSNASKIMQACCEMGVHFALDDFGTGYSSLTYLKRLPVDILKIDRSFVQDMLNNPEDLSIVEGVIGLAKSFNRQVIAEGVETSSIGETLMALGCDLVQGYAIAQPMPGVDLPGWVVAWQQHSARM